MRDRFWETVPMADMTRAEWEALCDGCGRCCVIVLEDEVTGEFFRTSLACRLFDGAACRCGDYPNRKARVPDCIQVTPQNAATLDHFPATCAYRLVAAGTPLPDWHHLVCGDPEEVHRNGPSMRGRTISEDSAGDRPAEDFIVP